MLLVKRLQLRNFVAAGMAPGGPDIEQDNLAIQPRERDRVTRERLRRVRRRGSADRDRIRFAWLAGERESRSGGAEQPDDKTTHDYRKLAVFARATWTDDGRPGTVHAK